MSQPPDDRDSRSVPFYRRIAWWMGGSRRRSLGVRAALALALLVVLIVASPSYFGWGLAVAAMIIAVPISKLRSLAVAFLPYGGAWLLFTVLRSLADETAVPLRTEYVTRIERWLFLGTTPTIWLQNQLFDPLNLAWYDYMTTFIHWSYFFVPHLLAIILWRKDPRLYSRYLVATIMLLAVGLLVYFLSPAAPPWLTTDTAPQEDIYRVMANVGREINSSLYNRTYSVVGDSNPVAAMPSMHEAITFLVALFCLRLGKWVGLAGMVYALAMAFSLVYSGEHYVIDTLVGSALATYCFFFAGRWIAMIAPLFQSMRRAPAATSPELAKPGSS